MKRQHIAVYEDIDWHILWNNARARKSWTSKGSKDWDKKATSFRRRNKDSEYVPLFLKHLDLSSELSVLDVGCGPGTLALPIAEHVKTVTALDYSAGMLEALETAAAARSLTNVSPVRCAWEDDWSDCGIGVHDIAIASRSMNIENLESGIVKLNNHASRQVYIADRIAPSPFDPDAFKAIGREFNSGPDYIYTINTLYKLGIHPVINHIELSGTLCFADMDEAFHAYKWMFRDLSREEEKRLISFLKERVIRQTRDHVIVHRRYPQRWALISWQPSDAPPQQQTCSNTTGDSNTAASL